MGLRGVLRTVEGDRVGFYCAGCKEIHIIPVTPQQNEASWGFDGDYDKPTFNPSVLIRTGHYALRSFKPGDSCWCTYNAENPNDPAPFTCTVCHTIITHGMVHYLADCTHALAGQTLPLTAEPSDGQTH